MPTLKICLCSLCLVFLNSSQLLKVYLSVHLCLLLPALNKILSGISKSFSSSKIFLTSISTTSTTLYLNTSSLKVSNASIKSVEILHFSFIPLYTTMGITGGRFSAPLLSSFHHRLTMYFSIFCAISLLTVDWFSIKM